MKWRIAVITFLLLISATGLIASDYYKLYMVKRLEKDLYSARSGSAKLLIETKFCYEYAIGSDALLKYERYSYSNKIIFDDDATCDVVKVIVQ